MVNEDNDTIKRIKQNNYYSFRILFEKYYPRLCSYVNEITNNREAAKDITQEFFIKLWSNRHQLDIQTNVSAYLYQSCKNGALNHIRKENTRHRYIELKELPSIQVDNDFLEEQELIAFVDECIEELPNRSRQVFLLSRFEGLKQKEIAAKLNISVKTIKNHIWKSLQYLRSCLEDKDVSI
uniref:RNA polymerase sigma factor n=1 Tax=uncultured Draconibacterium sp. TaxID=1573823 RepID=UPI0032177843